MTVIGGIIIVILVLILVIMLIAIGIILYIRNRLKHYSSKISEFKDFFDGINAQKEEFEEEPKTPYGIDNLVLPDITRDFPYMHVDQMKSLAEESIQNYFNSIEQKTVLKFNNPSEKLLNSLRATIEEHKNDNIDIQNVNFHKTVINKYIKNGSICTLLFQTAIGYDFVKNGSSKKIEDRINTEFIYVYDDKNIKLNESISLHCPSCGAPIKGLGHKTCPYCTAGLIDIAPKTWKLNDIIRL